MAERRLIILNYLSGVPAFASCSKCGHKFFAPAALQFDRSEARDYLEYKFLLHECPSCPQTRFSTEGKFGKPSEHERELRDLFDQHFRTVHMREDFSQAAARIVREATEHK